MRIVLASTNPHKLEEIRAVIDGGVIDWHTLGEVPGGEADEPVEDADTFEGNAAIKARYYAQATGELCLADDSGLAVDALGGAPGVISARYAGAEGPREQVDWANNRKLLAELGPTRLAERTARFVCAMVLWDPQVDAAVATVRGTVEGRILLPDEAQNPEQPERGRGENGFGYDPLFVLPERGVTTAELTPDQKNAISHRGNAVRAMAAKLDELGWL
jgi:XTP/dITP diphosphohydrolase